MLAVRPTGRYARDLKLAHKRRRPIRKLEKAIDLIACQDALPPRLHDHALTGNWAGHRECHIEPDWLLIYKIERGELILVRTGTHSDLFKR